MLPATAFHRGGEGPPLVLLHGFTDTWRTWELVLPHLEDRHEVLAPTLPGHLGGPPLADVLDADTLPDAVESLMDDQGIGAAHLVGNSLGGFVALQLAARGRARSVTALAPAGGWTPGAEGFDDMLAGFLHLRDQARIAAPFAHAIAATAAGRRSATRTIVTDGSGLPAQFVAHLIGGVAGCADVDRMVAHARAAGYALDAARITCPVRIVWGTADAILPWPQAAERFRHEWLPRAEVVLLDGVGHCPQLDAPLETAALILGLTGG